MSHEDFCFKLIIINAIINNVTIMLKDNVTGREVLKIVYGTFFHIFMELKCASKWKTMTVLKVCPKNAFKTRNVSETYMPPHGAKFRFIFSVEAKPVQARREGIKIYKLDNTLGSKEWLSLTYEHVT